MSKKSVLLIGLFLFGVSCTKENKEDQRQVVKVPLDPTRKLKKVRVLIDRKTIAEKQAWEILDPVKSSLNLDGSHDDYVKSVARFSKGQRYLSALDWYLAEVNNGGHDQFYSNPTGILWDDALKGCAVVDAPTVAEIIAESAKRMGGQPSFDQDERSRILDQRKPKFADLDKRIFKLDVNIEEKMLNYIRQRPNDFLFDGEVARFGD